MLCVNCHQKQVTTPYIAARLKKRAYGMNDSSQTLVEHPLTRHCVVMAWFPHELIDCVACCTHHSRVSELGNPGDKKTIAQSQLLENSLAGNAPDWNRVRSIQKMSVSCVSSLQCWISPLQEAPCLPPIIRGKGSLFFFEMIFLEQFGKEHGTNALWPDFQKTRISKLSCHMAACK